jgi:hypothetical protein
VRPRAHTEASTDDDDEKRTRPVKSVSPAVDPKGVVIARFFEDAYQERYTAAAILATQGAHPGGVAVSAETTHLSMRGTISDATVAPGERVSIVLTVAPRSNMHVYAPGKHDYRIVRLSVDRQPWLRAHDTRYPPSEIYHFKPLDERVDGTRSRFA